ADGVPIPNPADTGSPPATAPGLRPYGWAGAPHSVSALQSDIYNFINNTGNASIGTYFGQIGSTVPGPGWPNYYIPNSSLLKIPSGENVFANSPLTNQTSSYEKPSNHWILTTAGTDPINVFGSGTVPSNPTGSTVDFTVNFNALPPGNNGTTLEQMLQNA